MRHYLPEPRIIMVSQKYRDILEYGFIDERLHSFGYPNKKSDHEKRILFLGDSFMDSGGIANKFGELLNNYYGAGSYVVRTIATSGWGTDQAYIAFRNLGLPFQPEIVILAFCLWNDIANNLSCDHGDQTKPFFVLHGKDLILQQPKDEFIAPHEHGSVFVKPLQKGHSLFLKKSRIYFYLLSPLARKFSAWINNYLKGKEERTRSANEPKRYEFSPQSHPLFTHLHGNIDGLSPVLAEMRNYYVAKRKLNLPLTGRISHFTPMIKDPRTIVGYGGQQSDLTDYGYQLTMEILELLDSDVRSYGGRFYILLLPFANPFNWRSSASEQVFPLVDGEMVRIDFIYQINTIKALCLEKHLHCIDFTETMEQEFPDTSKLIRNPDVHYNELGEEFVARELVKYFRKYIEPQN